MRIAQTKVYEFDELSDEAKETAITNYRNSDNLFLDTFNDCSKESITEKGFSDVELQYSLGYSQGDGLSFSGTLDLRWFLDNKYSIKLPEYKKSAICELVFKVYSKGNSSRYCYASHSDIDFDYNDDQIDFNFLEKLWNQIFIEIVNHYISICKQLEKDGYTEIEYQNSEEYIQEYFDGNNIEFTEYGKIF